MQAPLTSYFGRIRGSCQRLGKPCQVDVLLNSTMTGTMWLHSRLSSGRRQQGQGGIVAAALAARGSTLAAELQSLSSIARICSIKGESGSW